MRLDALPPFDGPAQDPDGEPWETLSDAPDAPDARHRPVTLSGGNARGSDLIWTQKSCIARWIGAGRESPVPVVACYAAPSADALRAVLAQHAPSRVLVVTDLDPWGWALAQHLLAHLAPDLPVLHRGVGDALLALSDAWLPTDGRRDPLTRSLPLSASEMARWQWLRPRCAEAMGPASRALLDAGCKREVEGATNPDCHRPGFTDALRRYLLAP